MKELDNLINKINLMPANKNKACEIYHFMVYAQFLYDSKQISDDVYNYYKTQIDYLCDSSCFKKHYISSFKNITINTIEAYNDLREIYEEVLTYANNFPQFSTPIDIDKDRLKAYAEIFFKWLSDDIYDLYTKLNYDDMIIGVSKHNASGTAYNINYDKYGIVLKHRQSNINETLSLIHEMGHIYHYYLNRNHLELTVDYVAAESMSQIFERLFFIFLRKFHLLSQNDLDKQERTDHLGRLWMINSAYITNILLSQIGFIPDENSYTISDEDFQKLSIINVPGNIGKYYKKYIKYDANKYAYGYLLSLYIDQMFYEDELATRDLIKNLPFLFRELPGDIFINAIGKEPIIEAANKYTEKTLSKVNYK